jgi:hypothetical protein
MIIFNGASLAVTRLTAAVSLLCRIIRLLRLGTSAIGGCIIRPEPVKVP